MKNIIKFIIALSLIFSSLSTTFAEEWYIEKLLNLNYGIEAMNLNLKNINYINFNNEKYNKIYNELNTIDNIFKKNIMKNYRESKYWYYQINWIIKNYNNFIYHTNMFLSFLKIKENNNSYSEINHAIINSYTSMKESYNNMKNIIK